ncbi:MAG TPA: hypothetical protein VFN48_07075 [Solirubrobacteraceae bacterium]|nr:hypothetical protein [Solirubrobacteraceae bacterium]
MHALFGDVLWAVLALGVIASVWAMKGAAKEWEDYNERGLYMESVRAARKVPVPQAVAAAERDSEIRQMIEARNARRLRRGEAALDVEAEISRLTGDGAPGGGGAGTAGGGEAGSGGTAPGLSVGVSTGSGRRPDPELEDEVRALVELRNQRRLRKGLAPLDVDAEMARELDELSMLRHGPPPPRQARSVPPLSGE